MAESDSNDRNLPATARKLQKAREDGQVARSRELGHFAAIAAGGFALVALAPRAAVYLKDALAAALRFDGRQVQQAEAMSERLLALTQLMLWLVLPMGVLAILLALAGGVATGGWNWTLKPVLPRFDKFNPITGLARIVSKSQLLDALKGAALTVILITIGAFWLRGHMDAFGGLLALPLPAGIEQAARTIEGGMVLLVIALALFAVIDVPLQRFQLAQRLKMSHTEVKQEHKENEGNGEVKAKMRARMREITKRRMIAAVPKADLVVMNPTHYAVALKYDDTSMGAPRVVAKGADLLALKIRDVAKGAQVPVLQAPVLARALYAHAELDREIPAALFAAVAQVLAYVYQLRAALAGQAAQPGELPELNVPQELDPHHKPVTVADQEVFEE